MLALDRAGAEMVICAPDMEQMHVVNHHTGEVAEGESRNVRIEAARIARGPVADVADIKADDLDALILPGGFGAAKNLCDFAVAGADCEVNPDVAALVREVHAQGKPVAAVCIAPVLLAKVLGSEGPALTIGNDADTAGAMETLGATHIECPVTEFVIDRERKLITSPAYMLAQNISEAAEGIEKTVAALMELA
jgi:enhancing lycopene biosynthesis protein 2